ncbi:MAG: hypothetical protein ACMVP2_26055 [Imperialibacter sp.]|uniref:hypothetical protein n=1 Tax=Imperialibacter sp. TaxID=2038411 RepID=UPI003A8656BC
MKITIPIISLFFLFSCNCSQELTDTTDPGGRYAAAADDAIKMEPGEFYNGLRVLEEDSVLLVTWISGERLKGYKDSWSTGKPLEVKGFNVWATAVPDLKNFCDKEKFTDLDKAEARLKQLLGLRLSSDKQYFVELKVKRDDVFRPAPDANVMSVGKFMMDDFVAGPNSFKKWYLENLKASYAKEPKIIWTRLGYTYDWGNPYSEIGLSEFVIPGTMDSADFKVEVVNIYNTEQYCLLVKQEN